MGSGIAGTAHKCCGSRTGTSMTASSTSRRIRPRTRTSGTTAIGSPAATLFFLPRLSCGSFRFQPLLPTADHATEFLHLFRDSRVFLCVERMCFPCYAEHKPQNVSFPLCGGNRRKLFTPTLVARDEQVFKYLYEQYINSVAKRIARLFWKVIPVFLPTLVYCYRMLKQRQIPSGGGLLQKDSVHPSIRGYHLRRESPRRMEGIPPWQAEEAGCAGIPTSVNG